MKLGQITPGFSKEEYAARRQRMAQYLSNDSVVLLPAAKHHMMTNDIPYRYRQNNNFLYLSGFHEPSSVIAIEIQNNKPYFILFVQPRDSQSELWHGPRTGVERVVENFYADEAHPISHLRHYLELLPKNKTVIYNNITTDEEIEIVLSDTLKDHKVEDAAPFFDYLRLIKSPEEINMMKKSTQISAIAFIEVMKNTKHCQTEHQLEATMEYHCKMNGAERLAYPPVVSNGITNNILHYINNDNVLSKDNLILMDAGAEYNCFASDITRSWPVSGKFTDPQALVYNEVLGVLKKCTEAVRENNTLASLHSFSVKCITESLKRLGLPSSQYQRFYPHSIGHWLGMDVHDVNSVSLQTPFCSGMFVTVEPGIYIPNDPDIPRYLRGIGIRIEDDVLVTKDVPFVFTTGTPKEIEHIEALCNS